MKRRIFQATLLASALTLGGLHSAHAQQTIKLTAAGGHPPVFLWVKLLDEFYIPEVDKRLAAGGKYKIQWKEAFGGQLYKANATLTSVEQGITDIGWVFHNLEAAKMPLSQFGTVTPFTTDDVRIILDVANEMNEKVPALQKEWDKNNMVFLGATGVDTYHLFTKNPIATYADLKGRKISAPGSIGLWLKGSGAVPVDGAGTLAGEPGRPAGASSAPPAGKRIWGAPGRATTSPCNKTQPCPSGVRAMPEPQTSQALAATQAKLPSARKRTPVDGNCGRDANQAASEAAESTISAASCNT